LCATPCANGLSLRANGRPGIPVALPLALLAMLWDVLESLHKKEKLLARRKHKFCSAVFAFQIDVEKLHALAPPKVDLLADRRPVSELSLNSKESNYRPVQLLHLVLSPLRPVSPFQ
jgi:hypothetical protein